MAIVNVNGISGINSITAQSGSLNFYTAAGNNLPISAETLNVGTGASVSSPTSNVLTLGTNNSERVRIDSSGSVGIGTTNPQAKLNVDISFDNTATSFYNSWTQSGIFLRNRFGSGVTYGGKTGILMDANSGEVGYIYVHALSNNNVNVVLGARTSSTNERDIIKYNEDGQVQFLRGVLGSETVSMHISDTGSVGIGNTNPTANLQVSGTTLLRGNNGINTETNPNYSGTWFSFDSVPNVAQITAVNASSASLAFYTKSGSGSAPAERVRITSDGSVGIGSTSASAKLHIRTESGTDTAGSSNSHILFDLADDSGPGWAQRLWDSGAGSIGLDGSFALDRRSGGTWTNVLTAKRDTGNLGIGTNNPFAKTHIQINAAAGASSGSAAALWLRNANQTANNSATIFAGNDSSAACAAINFVHANYSNNQGFISFDTRENALTYNSNAMKIDAYGRVTSQYQPMAYVTYSGTAIIRGNIIPFTAVTNQGGHWDNSTYRFTCPVAGVYHASLNMTGNTTQSVQVQSSIRKNTSPAATSYYPGGPVSISILCAANDYIDFFYNHDNTGYPGATPAQASVYLLG